MIIANIAVSNTAEYVELSGDVTSDAGRFEPQKIWFRYPLDCQDQIKVCGDPFLAAMLLPAMVLGEPLRITAPVSPQLLKNQETIQAIFTRWVANTRPIEVEALVAKEIEQPGKGIGCFFSGGVDSFYSYLQHQQEISHLILLRGFDQGGESAAVFDKIQKLLEQLAITDEKQQLVIETNCRTFSKKMVSWDIYHGSVLAAVGLGLPYLFQRIHIPSTYSYAQLHPWGSHPLLDPLWSTGMLEFNHDSCGAGRLEKIRAIAASDSALQMLRVCWRQEKNEYNCCRCEKCLRTMVSLNICGKLDAAITFNKPLSFKTLKRVRLASYGQLCHTLENIEGLAPFDDDFSRKVAKVLKRQVRRFKLRMVSRILRGKLTHY